MLHIRDLIPTPIWDYQSIELFEDLEIWEGLDLANSFKYLTEVSFTDHIDIFMDASKNENGVGAAFVVPSKSIVQKFKLDGNLTVFDAEVIALTKAANFVSLSFTPGANVRICSDSKSAISTLKSFYWSKKPAPETVLCHTSLQEVNMASASKCNGGLIHPML